MAEEIRSIPAGANLADISDDILSASKKLNFDWKRIFFIVLGLVLFFTFYFMK